FCFFFSSRRRHTRSKRDWSSDVCSSDLPRWQQYPTVPYIFPPVLRPDLWPAAIDASRVKFLPGAFDAQESWNARSPTLTTCMWRSEERRVGKECRSGRTRRHEEKKERQI